MNIEKAYELAKEQYAAIGVDTDAVLEQLQKAVISMHCWQGDDVGGFPKIRITAFLPTGTASTAFCKSMKLPRPSAETT